MFPAYCTGQDVIFKEHCSRKPRAMGSGSEFGLAPDRKAWAEDKPRSLSPGPPSLNLRPPLASLGSENASARGRPAWPCGAQCFLPTSRCFSEPHRALPGAGPGAAEADLPPLTLSLGVEEEAQGAAWGADVSAAAGGRA